MVVAGEQSGDQLGAGFIREIKQRYPHAQIVGVGGPAMAQAGCELWDHTERLAVMGLWEVIQHLPDLLRLRRSLVKRALRWQPDVFVGIDAPDFNLPLALRLRQKGIKTVHYVSPSVWAWRQNRVHRIRASVDLMLTLFPFEGQFYEQHQVPHQCVGHPFVDRLVQMPSQNSAKQILDAPDRAPIVAILPGSRAAEVARIAPIFLSALNVIKQSQPDMVAYIAAASDARAEQLQEIIERVQAPEVRLVIGQTPTVLAAADVVLVASGTATLETALLGKPMVVGYQFNPLTFWLGRWFVKSPWFALPNILLARQAVPELIQNDLTASQVAQDALVYLQDPQAYARCRETLAMVSDLLGQDVDRKVAQAVLKMGGFRYV